MQNITVIIAAASKDTESQWMQENIDPAGGLKSFAVPLTNNGSSITHYCFSNQWSDDDAASLIAHYGANAYTGTFADALSAAGVTKYSSVM